jgi:hypothetical protein
MADSLRHNATGCPRCETVPPDVPRRHWKHEAKVGAWHIIADGAGLATRLPHQAHFLTILRYQLGPSGFPALYEGPLYFEFDADNPVHALEDLRRVVERLCGEYGCPVDALHAWHSGGRGFHVTISPLVIGAEAGHPQLPRVYAAMIANLFPPDIAPTLDRSVYNMGRGRMWRLPNRRRSDTGRYKVPVAIREVLHNTYGELEAFSIRPRKGTFWPADGELAPCPALVQCYQQATTALRESAPRSTPGDAEACIPTGRRNATLARLAGAMRPLGASEDAIIAALLAENHLRCDPPLPEAEIRHIAASIARYRPAALDGSASGIEPAGHGTRGGLRTIAAQEVLAWRR